MSFQASNHQNVARVRRAGVETGVPGSVVLAAQRGDRDALRRIYESCRSMVFRLVQRLVGASDAEDLLQESFVKAFAAIEQFGGESRFETWLYRIAVNESLQHLRRRGRGETVRLTFELMDETPHHERRHDDAELLQQALNRLDPELRSVFVLREVEQLSYRDLAEALGLSEGTVASRLNRARRLLKQYLTELGWEG